MFNLKRFTIIYIIVVLSVQAVAAGESETDKKIEAFRLKLLECQTTKIKENEVASTQDFSSSSAEANCNAGRLVYNISNPLSPPRCEVTNKSKVLSYTAPPGFKIIQSVDLKVTKKTDRGQKSSLSYSENTVSITLSCNGNQCDRGDREWISGYLVGQIQKIVTDQEIKEIQKHCLGELSK